MSRRLTAASEDCNEVLDTPIKDCKVIKTRPFKDQRGYFYESYNALFFHEVGLPMEWSQDNISYSTEKIIRGLHIQSVRPQGKLVRCISGAIMDVCVDLRQDSPTFKEFHWENLTEGKAMYCPPGTAHGFAVLSKDATIYYKCTSLYDQDSDGGILWNDPDLGIEWPWSDPVVSAKDMGLPKLDDYLNSLK